jgi:hypothetical protein
MTEENQKEQDKDVNIDPMAAQAGDLADDARKSAEEEARRGEELQKSSLRSTHEDRSFNDKLSDLMDVGIKTTATKSTFPLSQAFGFSFQGIRLRLGRLSVVLLGISLAIAFCGFLLTNSELIGQLAKTGSTSMTEDQREFQKWWIWIAVAVAFVGITNAVMMSVTERIKEIGTIKCLGACDSHVIVIFLIETVLLGMIGGVLGSFLGYGLGVMLFKQQYSGYPETILSTIRYSSAMMVVPKCIGLSMIIALISSVGPVWIAAKVEPAEAMRYEV